MSHNTDHIAIATPRPHEKVIAAAAKVNLEVKGFLGDGFVAPWTIAWVVNFEGQKTYEDDPNLDGNKFTFTFVNLPAGKKGDNEGLPYTVVVAGTDSSGKVSRFYRQVRLVWP